MNIPILTPQQMFDTVARHLLTQGEKSMPEALLDSASYCQYRGTEGRKCAIGILIPDSQYKTTFEGVALHNCGGVTQDIADEIRRAAGITEGTLNLAGRLQQIHDMVDASSWHSALRHLAEMFNLSTDVLTEFRS